MRDALTEVQTSCAPRNSFEKNISHPQVHGCSGGSGSSTSGGKSPVHGGYDSDGEESNSSSAGSISVAGGAASPPLSLDVKSEYKQEYKPEYNKGELSLSLPDRAGRRVVVQ